MANMESFNFDTSATNYAEVSYDGSKVANQALAETDKIYAAHYERMKKDAIADAETRSRNYQKFGKLLGQAGEFKKKLDAWNDSKSLESDLKEGTASKGGEEVQTGKPKVDIEKEQEDALKKEENAVKVEGEKIAAEEVAANNAAPDNKDQAVTTYDTLKVKNIETYNENSASSSKKLLNTSSTFIAKNLNAPVGNAMVPGANGRSYNQLLEDGDDSLAEQALFFWGRSALVQSGALTTLKGRHKSKLLKDLRKNIDGITTKSMNRRIEEELKLGEVKEILNLSSMLVNNPEGISDYVFGNANDPNSGLLTRLSAGAPGGPDAAFGMAKLGDRLEKAFEQGYVGTEELQLLRDTMFAQKGTDGKQTTIKGLNTKAGNLLDRKLGALIQKSQKKELDKITNERKINAESGMTTLIEGYRAQNKEGKPVTLEQKEKDIAKLAKDLNLSPSDPLLKRLNDYYVPGDYDDEEEAQWLLADIRKDGKIDGGDLAGRLAAIENGTIRAATKKKAEALLAGFEPSKDHETDAARIFNAMVNKKTVQEGNTTSVTVLDPDKASEVALGIIANMEQDYQELYAEAFAISNNADKAHKQAIAKIKDFHRNTDKHVDSMVNGKVTKISKYADPNMGQEEFDFESSMVSDRTREMLNKDMEGTLNSSRFLMGEAKALPIAIRALKNNTGVIPEYYLNLSKKTGIHPLKLMKMRMEAMGIDPKEADPNNVYFVDFPDDDLSEDDKRRLNMFPTPSNVVQIMNHEQYSDGAKQNIFYNQMARQGADHDSFTDTTGRTYKINMTEQSISNVGNMFNNNKSRTGIQYGAKVKVGKYDWNKNTFEAALERSGIDPSEPFTKENQDALLRAHQSNILYSDNMLSSLEAFGGDTELTSYEPVQIDFNSAAVFSEEFGTDPFMQPNSLSTGLFNAYYLIEQ